MDLSSFRLVAASFVDRRDDWRHCLIGFINWVRTCEAHFVSLMRIGPAVTERTKDVVAVASTSPDGIWSLVLHLSSCTRVTTDFCQLTFKAVMRVPSGTAHVAFVEPECVASVRQSSQEPLLLFFHLHTRVLLLKPTTTQSASVYFRRTSHDRFVTRGPAQLTTQPLDASTSKSRVKCNARSRSFVMHTLSIQVTTKITVTRVLSTRF